MAKDFSPHLTPEVQAKTGAIAEKISSGRKVIVFTGAGISTESGIPDYRSQGGIWDKFTPVYFDEFMSSETARFRYWEQRMDMEKGLKHARPNTGHMSIARLYETGHLACVITQNIDGLHQASGIPDDMVIELHGNTRRVRCMSCRTLISWDAAEQMILAGDKAPRCGCGGYLKPDTISFGQAMPEKETRRAVALSSQCDVFIVVGSTLLVQPAALMPGYALDAGAFVAIINLSPTPYDNQCHVLIRENAGPVLADIAARVS
ncbi:MAG: SIR2 family NAD-dependent protein deacylase [Thermodesulfobacteriota bacterium]